MNEEGATAMIIDHRTYKVRTGKLQEYLKLYETEGLPIQRRHLGDPLGWYVCTDIGPLNTVVHLWAYASLDERAKKRAALQADPGWQTFLPKAQALLETQENKILSPAPFFTQSGRS